MERWTSKQDRKGLTAYSNLAWGCLLIGLPLPPPTSSTTLVCVQVPRLPKANTARREREIEKRERKTSDFFLQQVLSISRTHGAIATMATLLGQQPPSSRPSHEFAPSSPPDRHMFHQQSEETPVGPPLQYRSSIEFRRTNGPGFADANSGPPLPHGPQMMPNGGSRHRGTLSLGAFEGGKSPPGTKSRTGCSISVMGNANQYSQTPPTFPASSSGPANVRRGLLAPSHTLSTFQTTIHRVNILPKCVSTNPIC